MSSWGNNDNAANAPYWAVNSTIVNAADVKSVAAAPTAANVAILYANTQADAYTTGETIGLFGVNAQEALATHAQHQGWVLRTTGSGGRAGRVQNEVLVALSNMGANGVDGDGQAYANVAITFTGPSNGSVLANATYFANVVSFTATPTLTGNTSATLTYQWQYVNGSGVWLNIPANTNPIQWSGATSTTLQARPATTANNGTVIRLMVTAADQGVTANSANATLTVA